ncbi:uncharacterized protein LOC118506553 [Anopheles stephensi]|uniref:uncharacterized protein LOC118506553 n=1 Tax=Anopheles stephensi TaxID=30069 RepID=UPI001658725A|nr:uncharacterized protein LOC118506553 [Anopheles stephensi]
MIRTQPPRKSKDPKRQTSVNGSRAKKEPKARTQQKTDNQAFNGEAEQGVGETEAPISRQVKHSAIEPIILHQAGNPGPSFLTHNAHHTILQLPAQLNVIEKDTLFSHFKPTRPFTAAHPMPLHTTPGLGPTTPDLMVRALHTKHAYHRELEGLEKRYENVTADHPLDPSAGENMQHTVAVVYAALLDRDPDPYLQVGTGYDYHFTGGTLVARQAHRSSESGCIATLFKSIGASLEDVEVLRVEVAKEDDLHCHGDLKVSDRQACPTGYGGPILEIVPDDGGNSVVLVRKRNVIIVLREVETDPSGAKEWRAVQNVFSTNPLASVCFVSASPAQCPGTIILCTTDYRRQLQLWTVGDEEESCEDIVELPKLSPVNGTGAKHRPDDKWSAVRCVDRNHLLVACLDRRTVHFYGIERNAPTDDDPDDPDLYRLVHRGAMELSRWTYECEQCCALEVTPSERLLFIATSHKLIVGKLEGGDPSAPDANIGLTVLLVFTHNLKQRPVFISHQCEDASAESDKQHHFVLFGSHLPMGYGVAHFTRIANGTPLPVYAARHYPYHPPTFHDSYKLAQTRGCCISAYQPLQKRFDACQSGAVLIRRMPADDETGDQQRLHILLQTSAGDLLQQRLTYNFDRDEEPVADHANATEQTRRMATVLQRWHEMLVRQAGQLPYRVTSFKPMVKFRDIFNCPVGGNELKRILYLTPKMKRKRRRTKKAGGSEEPGAGQSEQEDNDGDDDDYDEQQPSTSSWQMKRSVERRRRKHGNEAPPIPWRQTVEQLQQYRDVLAPAMLAVWGVGDAANMPSQATNVEQIPTKLPPLADVNERVGSWVNGTITAGHDDEHDSAVDSDDGGAAKRRRIETDRMPATQEDTVADERDLFSPPFTSTQQSQTLTGSQLSQTGRRVPRKMYSKGF